MKGTFYSCSSQSCDQFWENEQQAIEVFLKNDWWVMNLIWMRVVQVFLWYNVLDYSFASANSRIGCIQSGYKTNINQPLSNCGKPKWDKRNWWFKWVCRIIIYLLPKLMFKRTPWIFGSFLDDDDQLMIFNLLGPFFHVGIRSGFGLSIANSPCRVSSTNASRKFSGTFSVGSSHSWRWGHLARA